ncbi:MAG: glycosyltransferase [Ignavibacteriales bacterium]|nr:glycosyltransferase [Ignavibacteriales bacterium]
MKISLFSHYDIQRPLTNAVADMRLCEGLAEAGAEVTLVVPEVHRSDNIPKESVFDVFNIKTKFSIKYLQTNFRLKSTGKLNTLKLLLKCSSEFVRITKENAQTKYIVSRNIYLLFPFLLLNKLYNKKNLKFITWSHEISNNFINKFVYKRADFFLATNSAIKEDLMKIYDIPVNKFEITLNPISSHQVLNLLTKEKARKQIKYFQDKPLVVYTGKLFIGQKEISYILMAASEVQECTFLFTGGKPDVKKYYENYCASKSIPNCIFTGYLHNYNDIKLYQFAADILVSYYTKSDHLVDYNLPSKICEYMLSGNVMITPRYRATKDLLNVNNAYFVNYENSASLIKGIKFLINNRKFAQKLGKQARDDVINTTSNIIGKNIIESFKRNFH